MLATLAFEVRPNLAAAWTVARQLLAVQAGKWAEGSLPRVKMFVIGQDGEIIGRERERLYLGRFDPFATPSRMTAFCAQRT
jgi:hypothetical protein